MKARNVKCVKTVNVQLSGANMNRNQWNIFKGACKDVVIFSVKLLLVLAFGLALFIVIGAE